MGFWSSAAREFNYLRRTLRTLRRISTAKLDGPDTAADMIERWAARTPQAVALLFEDVQYTYADYDAAGSRYARWALAQGVKRGDVVALLMENRPEYLFAWLGMAKIGAVTALINTNQTGHPLAHSLTISGARHLILGAELAENYQAAAAMMAEPLEVWATGGAVAGAHDLDDALARADQTPVGREMRVGMSGRDNLFYIYTSGTTGNPKAANFSHFRFQQMALAFSAMSNAGPGDRMYAVLPLYHTAGGVCGIGQVLSQGGSVVIRRRFSVSAFWDDVHRYRPTLFQYIGELCRYLLNAPHHPHERGHSLRLVVGNGLRPEIWAAFQTRFALPEIVEFYGSTEGNVALVNQDGTIGAIGRVPNYMRSVFNVRLVRFDVETETHPRGADGFCIECAPGEVGEALGRISSDPNKPLGRFEGYKGDGESARKILRGVFETDDAYFRTGDLLRRDADGYFYFVDRIGDTFRWKGENVATSEVAEVLSVFPGIKEANVYGVKVPGTDGRAGMAALVTHDLDLDALATYALRNLPVYAVPLFLRLRPEIEITGTFKHRKVEYVREGFDPASVAEPLYFLDSAKGAYVPLDADLHRRICAGEVRL